MRGVWSTILGIMVGVFFAAAITAGAEPRSLKAGQVFYDCSGCPVMVAVPAGSFLMGSSVAETERDITAMPSDETETDKLSLASEHPQHAVTIGHSFAMARYLVTRGEFAAFVQESGYVPSRGCMRYLDRRYSRGSSADWQSPGFTQTDRDPVVCVTWNDAQAYVAWLNGKLGGHTPGANAKPYHLPSEAEWEYAARAGTRTVRWWGDSIGQANADCEGCGSRWDTQQPSPVGSFPQNPFGLFDMLGSSWEWTEDCWHKDYMGAPTDGSAWMAGESCGQYYAIRGGAFFNRAWVLRPAKRTYRKVDDPGNFVGFRVAKTLQ